MTTGKVTYPGHEGSPFWERVGTVDEPTRFTFVWPIDGTISPDDPNIQNLSTLVEFTLEPTGDGTRLTLRESGFDKLPENKRLQIFRDNEGGWDAQMKNVKAHVE